MKTETVKFGKYKGQPITDVPKEYANWHRMNGNKKFFKQWFKNSRFTKHTHFEYHTSPDGRWLSRKLEDGTFIFHVSESLPRNAQLRTYYLVDSEGQYIRDLKTFGSTACKQGALDIECEGWVTLTPMGSVLNGKMLIEPYVQNGFIYSTYKQNI